MVSFKDAAFYLLGRASPDRAAAAGLASAKFLVHCEELREKVSFAFLQIGKKAAALGCSCRLAKNQTPGLLRGPH